MSAPREKQPRKQSAGTAAPSAAPAQSGEAEAMPDTVDTVEIAIAEMADDGNAAIIDLEAERIDAPIGRVTAVSRPSSLDRAFEIRGASWLAIGWVVAIVAAIALRLGDLDRWALSAREGAAAFDAWRMYTGNPGAASDLLPAATPTPLLLQALSFFLFGVTDATFRMPSAIFGLAVLPLAWSLRRSIGDAAACCMALLAACSPILVQSSRTGDGQTIAAVSLLAVATAIIHLGREDLTASGARWWAVIAGIAGAAAIGCGAGGIFSLLMLVIALAIAGARAGAVHRGLRGLASQDTLIPTLAALIATSILLFSRIFTAPAALAGIPQALGDTAALISQPGPSRLGIMALLMLLLYEPVSALLAGYDLWSAGEEGEDRSPVTMFALWLGAGVIGWGLAAGAGPEHMVHLALPLVLMGGAGMARLLGLIDWRDVRAGRGVSLLLAILAASAAAFAVIVLLGRNPGDPDRLAVAAPAIGVAMLVLVPLLYFISRLASAERAAGTGRQTGRLALVALALMLGAFGLSSATHLIYERAGTGKEPIAQFVSTGAVRPTVDRLGRLARDAGVTDGSVRDVEGGHSLKIAIDERAAQPWRWYLRDFPFAEPVAAGATITGADAIISPPTEPLPDGYADESVPAITGVPDIYLKPDLPDLVTRIVLPEWWLADARYLHFREGITVPPPTITRLALNRSLTGKVETAAGPYGLDDRPGPGPGDGQLSQPVGIAVGPDGTTYVMDSGNSRVERYSADGQFVGTWDSANGISLLRTDSGFGPTGIATAPDGTVYLADTWNHRVLAVNPLGQVILTIGGNTADTTDDPAKVSDFPGQFFGPRAIAATKKAVFVADTGNERIQVFSPDGTFQRAFGGYGAEEGRLIEPVGLAIGPDRDLYVADSGNQRISVFSTNGEFLRSFIVDAWPAPDPTGLRPFFQPYLTFDQSGHLIVSSSDSNSIEIYDPATGTLLASLTGSGADSFSDPFGVAVALNGDVLAADSGANAVIRVPAADLPPVGASQ